MNIVVKPYTSTSCYCRPDTTWERENKDFYVPESEDGLRWAPILFARISKAGKHIGAKFVSRYYDGVGFGALMYGSEEETAFASCLDHTSILPAPLYNPAVLENETNIFEIACDGKTAARYSDTDFKSVIENAISSVSQKVSLRIGDMVAVELDVIRALADRSAGEVRFEGRYCENRLFDMKVIF